MTGLSLAAGLWGAWGFLQGNPAGWLSGAVALQISYILDNCDGELARMTGSSSGLGSWLDTIADCLIHMAFFLGLGAGLERSHLDPLGFLLGGVAAVGVFLTYVAFILEQVEKRGASALRHPDPPAQESHDFWGKLRLILRGDFSLVVLISAVLGSVRWLLWAGVGGAFVYCVSGILGLAVRGLLRQVVE